MHGVSERSYTIAELESALAFTAYIVDTHGMAYAPIFERLEREVAKHRQRQDIRARARKVAIDYTKDGGLKAIR